MGMHKGGRNDTENPGASVKKDSSVKNDIGKRGGKDLYLRDYITRKQESNSFYEPCNKEGDKWAVWPDGTECALEEKRDFEELLRLKSDDYEVKVAIGYDPLGYPVFSKKKLTFEEWFLKYIGVPFEDWDNNLQENDMRAAWNAAKENK